MEIVAGVSSKKITLKSEEKKHCILFTISTLLFPVLTMHIHGLLPQIRS